MAESDKDMNINKIQFKRGTAEALAEVNPVLLAGEMCIETDTGKYKFGNGTTAWTALPYSGVRIPSENNSVYVLKNGEYVQALLVEKPSEWTPSISTSDDIVIAVDEDMTPYQLTGTNVGGNS